FLAGMAGILSFLLIDLSAMLALVPVPAGTKIPTFTPALKLLSLIQPSLILAVAVLVGVTLASRVGLRAPVAEALAARREVGSALRPQVVPGIVGGVLGGIVIVLVSVLFKALLPLEILERIGRFGRFVPVPTRLLYGGITEELLLRWGFMTLLVWLAWRFLQKGRTTPTNATFVGAILISSLVFGLGHLPIAFMLIPEAGVALTLFVIIANSAFGLMAGYLYWKKGLESAMIAHMTTHLVMFVATYAGFYF
ncbi:MAG: CPBP family intramembrane glutamic endopeptidase, partial [Pyrinomonadaceae bacterium]